MSRQFKETEDSDDWEEFQDVSVLQVRGKMCQNQVDVEAESGNKVNDVHWTSDKIQNVWTGNKSGNKKNMYGIF